MKEENKKNWAEYMIKKEQWLKSLTEEEKQQLAEGTREARKKRKTKTLKKV